jgi:hypothetical protein
MSLHIVFAVLAPLLDLAIFFGWRAFGLAVS